MTSQRLHDIMSDETKWQRGSRIGLRNIRDRLKVIYGEKASFMIESEEGKGTRVVLIVPVVDLDPAGLQSR